MSPQLLNGIVVVAFVALMGSIAALYRRIRSLEITVAETKVQVSPLWAQVQNKIAQELHHDDPRYAEMDRLLEDLIALRISSENRVQLKKLLQERAADPSVTPEEQKSAKLMIAVMEKVITESRNSANVTGTEQTGGGELYRL